MNQRKTPASPSPPLSAASSFFPSFLAPCLRLSPTSYSAARETESSSSMTLLSFNSMPGPVRRTHLALPPTPTPHRELLPPHASITDTHPYRHWLVGLPALLITLHCGVLHVPSWRMSVSEAAGELPCSDPRHRCSLFPYTLLRNHPIHNPLAW
ncbi:hypothetical protein LZ31DRAFT_310473 [Colletotrichum somersetense]|nr:hypothetical protein LZ31DRAFT_310473 [Colletotrichum somersetense]